MKLTDINLSDRKELEAARALLDAILGEAVQQFPCIAHEDRPDVGAPENSTMAAIRRKDREEFQKLRSLSQLTQAFEPSSPEAMFGTAAHVQAENSMMTIKTPDMGKLRIADPELVHFTGHGQLDPAAVFGGAAVPLPPAPPIPAPSSAGAAPLPTAPVALPGTFAGVNLAPPPPAAHIADAVYAQTLASVTPMNPASGVELDKNGLPWDERIHAGSKTKTQKGVWTARRGLTDDAMVKRVEDELRALQAGGAGVPVPPPPSTSPAPFVSQPVPAPAQAMPSAPTASPTGGPATFEALMMATTPAVIAGKLPATAMQSVCASIGLPNVTALVTHPQFIAQVWAALQTQFPGAL